MEDSDRFVRSDSFDNNLLQQIMVGQAFVFLPPNVLSHPSLAWVGRVIGSAKRNETKGAIVSLFSRHPLELFGVKIRPAALEKLSLATVTSDKTLYKAERDTINLLVLNPLTPGVNAFVDVFLNDQEFSRHCVRLGEHGEGQLVLRDLPIGDYEIFMEAQKRCDFTVAEYRLVPLVASVLSMATTSQERIKVVLQMESFGVPVNGDVNVAIMDDDRRVAFLKASCVDGKMSVNVDLQCEGQVSLQLQLVKEPLKTATVPLRGTRKEERTQTLFSPLGTEVVGSLLEDRGAKEVRGIYLSGGATRTSPVRLEQVVSAKARIIANMKLDKVTIVAINPAHPQPMSRVVDRKTSKHPEEYDAEYSRASKLFNESHDYASACEIFEQRRAQHDSPHPYYSYWVACCKAKLGDIDGALIELKRSLSEGWDEFEHLANDEDLSALRGHPEFELLIEGGTKEIFLENVEPGQVIEVDGFSPVTILTIGAMISGKAWEGWASLLPPSDLSATVAVPDSAVPGKLVEIEVDCNKAATVYGVIKDARLISPDTARTRLAAGIKAFVESAAEELPFGFAAKDLASIHRDLNSVITGSYGAFAMPVAAASPFAPGAWGDPASPFALGAWGAAPSAPAGGWGAPAQESMQLIFGADSSAGSAVPGFAGAVEASPANGKTMMTSDPEVLFAGFVSVIDGKGILSAQLPDCFGEYIVECLAVNGLDWSFVESKFRAEKYPFASLTTPTFALASENARGTLHVLAASSKVRVQLRKDGKPVALTRADGSSVGADDTITGSHDLAFVAHPGIYEAALIGENGIIVSQCARQVDEPGRLKRRVRSLRLLEKGQSVAITDGANISSLKVMPGIENSFNLLVEATADYSHCCCEQTAAKIVAGCAMYMLAGDDEQRKKAEAVITAGIRREKSMWLTGKGFKVYPDAPNNADSYLGVKAATYLWNLSLLEDSLKSGFAGGNNSGRNAKSEVSTDLRDAIREGLEMVADVTKAYKMQWPPQSFTGCSEAYAALKFSNNGIAEKALSFVQKTVKEFPTEKKPIQRPSNVPPYMGQGVFSRMEKAYAAASLLKAGGASNLGKAVELADEVVSQFNEQGRLYSTCDSVAAMALMTELESAHVTGGSSEVEVNGRLMPIQDAIQLTEPVTQVRVLSGVATIGVERIVEEDWSKFSMSASIKVALEKDGKAVTKLVAGDRVDLAVTLQDGYVNGDLLWVCLPDCLSRMIGGGQVKMFSLDFEGESKIVVPLAATATTEGLGGIAQTQSFSVCVRNMFDEERGGSPGPIPVTVTKK